MVAGAAAAFIGAYVAAGADASLLYFLGALEDGVEIDDGPEYGSIEGGEDLPYPIDAYIDKHAPSAKMTLSEIPAEMQAILEGGLPTLSTSGGDTVIASATNLTPVVATAQELAVGGIYGSSSPHDLCPVFWQVVIRTPNEGTLACPRFRGYKQYWKCIIKKTGGVKYSRKGKATAAIEIIPHADLSVVIAVSGVAAAAKGIFGKVHFNFA